MADATPSVRPARSGVGARVRASWDAPAMRRFRRNPGAWVGLVIVVGLILLAVFAPWIADRPPDQQNLRVRLEPPSAQHLFGTDEFGRSMLSRVAHGARVSLLTGLVPVVAALLLGSTIGLIAGYFGGRLDNVLMRIMDVLLAFPSLLLALAVVGTLGPGLVNAVIAIAIVDVPQYARLVRSVVLGAREEDYVHAARALGANDLRLMVRHVLPNAVGPIVVQATLGVGFAILAIAGLSFLGLGVQPPTADWGEMLARGRRYLPDSTWLMIFPGLAVSLTVLGFNLLGDGLRDALDPKG